MSSNPSAYSGYAVDGGTLYRRFPKKSLKDGTAYRICVPSTVREDVMREIHGLAESNHFSMAKSLAKAARLFYWPGMFREVKKFVRGCSRCREAKKESKRSGHPKKNRPIRKTGDQVNVEVIGPFPQSSLGYSHLLQMRDRRTKGLMYHPLRKVDRDAVIHAFREKVMMPFRRVQFVHVPKRMPFTDASFQKVCEDMGIRLRYGSAISSPKKNDANLPSSIIPCVISK